MTFDVVERSNYDGAPVLLFEFQLGTGYWRYCSGEQAITVGDNVYQPFAISCDDIKLSGEPTDDVLHVNIDASAPIANMLNGSPPSEEFWLNLRRHHEGESDAAVIWTGYIASRKQIDSTMVELACNVLTAGFSREGSRLSYGRMCPHVLYSADCGVLKSDHATTFQVGSVAGSVLTASALASHAAGFFDYGFIEWVRYTGAVERRAIEKHTGDTITLLGSALGIAAGTWITAYPGCKRIRSECNTKFNNLSNYGGFAHLPGDSPFRGDPVF